MILSIIMVLYILFAILFVLWSAVVMGFDVYLSYWAKRQRENDLKKINTNRRLILETKLKDKWNTYSPYDTLIKKQ